MSFSPLSCYVVPLRPKYSPRHPILRHPQPTSLSQLLLYQCERPSFTPILKNGHNYSSVYLKPHVTLLFDYIQDDSLFMALTVWRLFVKDKGKVIPLQARCV